MNSGLFMALVITFVCYPAMVNEALRTREVEPVAINTNQLHSDTVCSLDCAIEWLLFRRGVSIGKSLQPVARTTTRTSTPGRINIHGTVPGGPAFDGAASCECIHTEVRLGFNTIK
jgi:hypothetical protein